MKKGENSTLKVEMLFLVAFVRAVRLILVVVDVSLGVFRFGFFDW
jgi:hypothetical protein